VGSSAPIKAVVFDIGGVLEHVADPDVELGGKWCERLGIDQGAFAAAMHRVDPDKRTRTGAMSEATYRDRCVTELGLTPKQGDQFMADMWDWYCGELDQELMTFARSLRPGLRTAILSNSAHGARREEVARYSFDDFFDPIIYSHEVGLAKPDPAVFLLTCARTGVSPDETIFIDDVPGHVAAARELGIHAILHISTPATIAAVYGLLTS